MANQKIVYNKFDIPIGRFLNTNMKIMLKSLIYDSIADFFVFIIILLNPYSKVD